eukprot:TRINITY_DN31443_c0_g1_i1.p1 TRINITY_DN31443_c0_g1~~TRINITY_DN31443_c0_g1_i1.p1  ORF type:complete len:379 (+),score=110.28 TRINITY_DN31443_c0_g1_i1:87-1223(+)
MHAVGAGTASEQWNALGPWMYSRVAVSQMDGMSPMVGWGEGKLLTVTNGWPKGAESSAVCLSTTDYPKRDQSVKEFEEHGKLEFVSKVAFTSPMLNAKYLQKGESAGLCAVKLTDHVAVADFEKQQPLQNTVPLESKRPKQVGLKSPSLACQHDGTNIAFSDFNEGSKAVTVWDCAGNKKQKIQPADGKVEDVVFGVKERNTLYCVTDNGYMVACDLRGGKKEYIAPMSMPMKTVSVSGESEHVVVAGGRDGVLVWDTRCTKSPIVHFDHGTPVTKVVASPHDPAVLASCTTDGRVWVWDISLSAMQVSTPPSELLFIHAGHPPATVTGITWAPHAMHPHTLCTTDTAGMLHMFTPAVLAAEDEEIADRQEVRGREAK